MKHIGKTGVIMILFMVAVLLSACATQPGSDINTQDDTENGVPSNMPDINGQQEPDVKDEVATSGKISMDKIYNYAALSNFEYDVITSMGGKTTTTNMKYSLESDTVDGKAAWVSTTIATVEGGAVLSKIWTDKTTFGCLKMITQISYNGQDMDVPAECPAEGPNAQTTSAKTPELDYVGDESVTVPLGKFNTKKYVLEGITYYYADSVPVPVKVTYANAATVMELVSWS